jgi:(2Fe-2S) ferredoxin
MLAAYPSALKRSRSIFLVGRITPKPVELTRRGTHLRSRTMRHLFVCTNTVGSGKPTCGSRGGAELLAAVQQRLLARRATGVRATACGCLGPCFDGPNAVVYPDAVWYAGLDESDADQIAAHLVDGIVHDAKRVDPPGS